MEKYPDKFGSPEEEINFLRQEIARKERELLERAPEADQPELETVAKEEMREYASFTPESVLKKEHQLDQRGMTEAVSRVEVASSRSEEILQLAETQGIRNALSVLEKFNDPYLTDDVHRHLIEYVKTGREVQNLKEGVPPWQVLHMTLFEVTLPEVVENKERAVKWLVSVMEQFYAGMQNIGLSSSYEHMALEIAVSDKSSDIVFYVAVPNQYIDLFEKQLFSLFPNASLVEQKHDYNIFVEGGVAEVATANLSKHPIYPLRLPDSFESDPFNVLLNAFSKIEHEGGGAAVQFIVKNPGSTYLNTYKSVMKKVADGMKVNEAISRSSVAGDLMGSVRDVIFSDSNQNKDSIGHAGNQDEMDLFKEKTASPIVSVNIRIAVSAREGVRAKQILEEIKSTFFQYENTRGNKLKFRNASGGHLKKAIKAFSFREFDKQTVLPLSLSELSMMMHFPGQGIDSSPEFKQSRAGTAPAPTDLPLAGTLLGVNRHRGQEKNIYITDEDRLRHFYIIGQTGTGKSALMKNMIIQDIQAGHGVCMIEPHGTDIKDVLAAVPEERIKDVIYFDPSHTEKVIGLNMLEYDPNKPEQKTFVVNELFSIFQRLYGANPESMGPMFEQYFRNATLLVMEDPESGNTLMDISRVMSDATYRKHKLSKAKNPVVVEFWQGIASKAGGEASLENIVPYIVSKFDVFTANDYMRPIIGQQKSSFNFRQIMDEKKILLVNLSKGNLGEINSNLIGMIVVGKILMAALSRADGQTKDFPGFYLHIDEFQNVTTDSISSILSEARKYKLGLTVAHQFIAQLEQGIRDAIFGNVGSMAAFRVGSEDADFLEKQFDPVFKAGDLLNIPNFQSYVRILANGTPQRPFSISTLPPEDGNQENFERVRELSYQTFARDRIEVEQEINDRYQKKL